MSNAQPSQPSPHDEAAGGPGAIERPRLLAGTARSMARLLAPFFTLILVFTLFAVLVPEQRFLSARNLENLLVQSTVLAAAAIGATLVILAAGLDLSVGSTLALSLVGLTAVLKAGDGMLRGDGMGVVLWPVVAVLAAVALGVLVGLVNGALVTALRVGPFIVTLGMLQIVRGAAKGMAEGQSIYTADSWLNPLLESVRIGDRQWMLLPPGVWIVLVLAAVTAALLRYTVLGRHIVAVGSNEETARLCGVRVRRVKIIVYTAAGFFAALAGVLQFSYIGLGDPTTASGLELSVIAAVVIGGGSLRGGEGTILGSLCGAIIIAVLSAGGVQMGWPTWLQEVMTGAIIVGAVALDRWRATGR